MSLFHTGRDTSLQGQLLALSTLRLVTSSPGQAFTHVRAAPVRVLSHVLASYLGLLGEAAKARAEQSGRTSVSFADALGAVEEVGMSPTALIELVYHLKANVPRSEAERERTAALHNTGQLLKSIVGEPRRGRRLVYELFSEEEVAALERAPEAESEPAVVEPPRPRLPSTSSSDLSDLSDEEPSKMHIDKSPSPVRTLKRKAEEYDEDIEMEEAALARWQHPDSIPPHVPPYLPPLPGLGRSDKAEDEPLVRLEAMEALPQPARPMAARQLAGTRRSGELWRSTIPYERSKLAEGGANPLVVPHITSAPEFELKEEGSMVAFHKLQQRMLDLPKPPEQLRPEEKRRKVASLLLNHRLDPHDSLYGAIPASAYRQSSRSAGWVPYAFDQLGRPSVYLRDFDGPMIDSLSTPMIPQPATFAPPSGRSPAILSHLTRQLALQTPAVASRLLRLAPPGPVDENGNTITYLLDDNGARLAVALPPHQNPLYFVPGWFWKTRDPLDEALPKETKPLPPSSAIESETPALPGTLESGVPAEVPAGEGPPPGDVEMETRPATEVDMTVDGTERGLKPLNENGEGELPSLPLQPASEDQSPLQPVAGPSHSRMSTAENGFSTPLEGGTPAASNHSGSVPPSSAMLPPPERRPSEPAPKIKLKFGPRTPTVDLPPAINTDVERSASPAGASAVTATPVSAGGTKLKLRLSFGGRQRSESANTPIKPLPTPPPVVKEEEISMLPVPPATVMSPALSRVSEEPELEPLVPMPPPKAPTPSQLMSPVLLQRVTNGVNGTSDQHGSPTPPSQPPPGSGAM